ncbi:MAG: homocysteine S-methyltransferase family protein [Thermoleophilia bacterium]|nr:homocysteine S-methyltransferase family protein [Thermoleophilia bacterium]
MTTLHRDKLPHVAGPLTLTDGGLETELIFDHGYELPQFASFPLLERPEGRAEIRRYFDRYAEIARQRGAGLVLESPTWRANRDWARLLGYDEERLDAVNRDAIALMEEIRADHADLPHVVISGCIGPRGDGYRVGDAMTSEEAEGYHARQIAVFAGTAADMVAAFTMTYAEEAVGITRAARRAGMPVAISFTLETDGRLPSGQPLSEAIAQVDAATGGGPDYYMINCAHPTHFEDVLRAGGGWVERIRGLRANASTRSHAELDEATELDPGDPDDLGARYRALRRLLPNLSLLGGCCGTDHRHVAAIGAAWAD